MHCYLDKHKLKEIYYEVRILKLGTRLMKIASFVPQGAKVADIGTDHAYLPIYLVSEEIVTSAIAGEVHKGPFQAAQEALKQHGYGDRILLRMGDGLEILSPHEVDVVTIAGMGGATIVDILSRYPEITSSLSKIIMQPMNAAALVRQWLLENHWMIADEALVKEDGRLYEIITAVQGEQVISEQILYDIGPLIWSKRLPFLAEHLQNLMDQSIRVLSEMDTSPSARVSSKYSYYAQKIKDLELKMSCL